MPKLSRKNLELLNERKRIAQRHKEEREQRRAFIRESKLLDDQIREARKLERAQKAEQKAEIEKRRAKWRADRAKQAEIVRQKKKEKATKNRLRAEYRRRLTDYIVKNNFGKRASVKSLTKALQNKIKTTIDLETDTYLTTLRSNASEWSKQLFSELIDYRAKQFASTNRRHLKENAYRFLYDEIAYHRDFAAKNNFLDWEYNESVVLNRYSSTGYFNSRNGSKYILIRKQLDRFEVIYATDLYGKIEGGNPSEDFYV